MGSLTDFLSSGFNDSFDVVLMSDYLEGVTESLRFWHVWLNLN